MALVTVVLAEYAKTLADTAERYYEADEIMTGGDGTLGILRIDAHAKSDYKVRKVIATFAPGSWVMAELEESE